MTWQWAPFEKLSKEDVYAILALRQDVFVVGQNCVYKDADGLDQASWHLMGWIDEKDKKYLGAYLRVLPPGLKYPEHCIGRVGNLPALRGKGIGKELMTVGLKKIVEQFGQVPIRISAQLYLKRFYEDFGFEAVGKEYQEDNIPHIEMIYNALRLAHN